MFQLVGAGLAATPLSLVRKYWHEQHMQCSKSLTKSQYFWWLKVKMNTFIKNGISIHQKLIVKVKPSSVRTVGRRLKYFLKIITCYFVFPCIHLSSVLFVPWLMCSLWAQCSPRWVGPPWSSNLAREETLLRSTTRLLGFFYSCWVAGKLFVSYECCRWWERLLGSRNAGCSCWTVANLQGGTPRWCWIQRHSERNAG